jgi:hypothetical protein
MSINITHEFEYSLKRSEAILDDRMNGTICFCPG